MIKIIELHIQIIFSISLFQLPLYSNRCCLQLREQNSSDLSWSQISVGWWLASDYHSYLTRPKSQHSILPELSFMQKKFPIACPSLSIQSQAFYLKHQKHQKPLICSEASQVANSSIQVILSQTPMDAKRL